MRLDTRLRGAGDSARDHGGRGIPLLGSATGTVAGTVTYKDGKKHTLEIGCPLFFPKEAAKKGVATIVGQHHPRLSVRGAIFSLQQPQKYQDMYSFDLDLNT